MIRPKYVGEEIIVDLTKDQLSQQFHCDEPEIKDCLASNVRDLNTDKTWNTAWYLLNICANCTFCVYFSDHGGLL